MIVGRELVTKSPEKSFSLTRISPITDEISLYCATMTQTWSGNVTL